MAAGYAARAKYSPGVAQTASTCYEKGLPVHFS